MLKKKIKKTFITCINIDRSVWLTWDILDHATVSSKKDPGSKYDIKLKSNNSETIYQGYLTIDHTHDYMRNKPTTRVRLFYDRILGLKIIQKETITINFNKERKYFTFMLNE